MDPRRQRPLKDMLRSPEMDRPCMTVLSTSNHRSSSISSHPAMANPWRTRHRKDTQSRITTILPEQICRWPRNVARLLQEAQEVAQFLEVLINTPPAPRRLTKETAARVTMLPRNPRWSRPASTVKPRRKRPSTLVVRTVNFVPILLAPFFLLSFPLSCPNPLSPLVSNKSADPSGAADYNSPEPMYDVRPTYQESPSGYAQVSVSSNTPPLPATAGAPPRYRSERDERERRDRHRR